MMKYLDQDLSLKQTDLYAQTKYQLIVELIDHKPLKILVVGCGTGELATLLASYNHQVVGIDPVSKYLAKARKLAKQQRLQNCQFIQSSIEQFKARKRFDVVIATDVLEHIKDDQTAILKMLQLCRRQMIITVPALTWLYGYHDSKLGHFRRYNKDGLQRLGEKLGEVAFIRYFGFSLIPVALIFSKILHKPYPIAEFGNRKKSTWKSYLLSALLQIEKRFSPPLGTSLIMEVVKN
jgi:SAM-dependent methyltransferase